jgi:potassium/hydrogen antiporter
MVWFRWTGRELVFVGWAGLRGAIPIVLATFPLTSGHPDGQLIFNVVFFVVLLSALVQGMTLEPLGRRLDLRPEPTAISPVEVEPLDALDADLMEVQLHEQAAVIGTRVRDAPPPRDARIVLIRRHGRLFVPGGDTTFEAGDDLVVSCERGTIRLEEIEAWLRGPGP